MSSSYQRPKILLLGDSLTQTSLEGWGGGLAHRYQRRADVVVRGNSGYNTRWYLRYAQDTGVWNEPGDVRLVTIFFGANDASLETENPHHFVPIPEYQENLKELVTLTKKHYGTSTNILLITPPPVHHEQRLAFQKERYKEKATGVLERTLENAGKYAKACCAVAEEMKLPCLDLHTLMVKKGDIGRFFYDGLHFSKEGHDFVLLLLLEQIKSEFPAIYVTPDAFTGQENNSGSSCPGIASSGPYHDKIDHTNWEKAFETEEEEPDTKRAKTE